jgi:transcriptional regulator with XRE-family HTH domain
MLLLQVDDEELRRLIGERIRIARGRSKLTQQQVAKAIGGVDKTQISKWEHGHAAPSALQLLHLGLALGERPETFLEGLVQLTWEKIALDLPDDAKAIVYDLAKYLKERGPVPRPASEINKGA